jgi:tetracycline resistance efflux pump
MVSRRALLGWLLLGFTWVGVVQGGAWTALWPSFLALAWVVVFRRVLLALVGGAMAGAILLAGGHPGVAFVALFEVHLLPHFGDPWKIGALIFTLVLGGFATVLERGGALAGWLEGFSARRSKRRLEGAALGVGVLCFFDGLANSLMVGRLFRESADRLGVPRERLAYIVDTTSAAVACVSFISTWIAFQISQIREGLVLAGRPDFADPYGLFFASIPFNFYCWFALGLLAVAIFGQIQLGAMREARALEPPGDVRGDERADVRGRERGDSASLNPAPGLWRFFLPLAVLIAAILGGIYWDGRQALGEDAAGLGLGELVAAAFGQAQAAVVMVWASVLGATVAVLCYPRHRGGAGAGLQAFEEGVLALFKPAMILVGAWMLSSVLGALEAREVLARLLGERLPIELLPAVVFLVAALTSFTTGTSWGTMGILMPLALPLAFSLDPGMEAEAMRHVVVGVVAAVFSGAVFGDHASPLSDTTIVSSIACGIEPHAHVRTQLPYALLAAGLALGVGFVPFFWLRLPGFALLGGLLILGIVGYVLAKRFGRWG